MSRHFFLSSCLAGSVLFAQTAFAQAVTVQQGDTLFSIASAQMGSGQQWRELCAANADVLGGDCDTLQPGMVLNIPGTQAPVAVSDPVPEAMPDMAGSDVVEPDMVEDVAPPADATAPVDVVYDFSALLAPVFTAPEGFEVDHQLPEGPARLSGNTQDAGSSGRPGIHLKLPDALEQAVSGKTVVVELLVRLDAPGEIDIAYSSNDVGNSGWQRFELGTAYDRIEFRYDVPEMHKGNGDYLGILPDPQGTGQVLEVSFIGISVSP